MRSTNGWLATSLFVIAIGAWIRRGELQAAGIDRPDLAVVAVVAAAYGAVSLYLFAKAGRRK